MSLWIRQLAINKQYQTAWVTSKFCSFAESRTALLLRTEMSILRDDKMRPLFQEAIVTKLAVTQSTTRYQMKAMVNIFPMMPHDFLRVRQFGHHSPAKLGIFPKNWNAKKCTFFTSTKNLFLEPFFQKAIIRRPKKLFPWNQLQIATNTLNFLGKKAKTINLNPF